MFCTADIYIYIYICIYISRVGSSRAEMPISRRPVTSRTGNRRWHKWYDARLQHASLSTLIDPWHPRVPFGGRSRWRHNTKNIYIYIYIYIYICSAARPLQGEITLQFVQTRRKKYILYCGMHGQNYQNGTSTTKIFANW